MFFASQPGDDWVVSTGFAVLRPKVQLVDARFLYFNVFNQNFTEYLITREKGAAYPAVLPEDIANAEIPLPPLPEQKAIAHILGTLDDKIELNRRMNETLEGMARALFKSWFVDFDPVLDNTMAAGNPIPEEFRDRAAQRAETAQSAASQGRPFGLPEPLAAQFPNAFHDSDLGPIPQGWEVKALDEIANYLNGLALQKYPAVDEEEGLPVIKIAEMRAGTTDSSQLASTDIPDEYVVDDGDVLFSWSGSLLVRVWCGGPGALNQHLFKVTSKTFPKWFYYHWTLEHLHDFQAIAAAKATTMGHIQRHHLSQAMTYVPERELLESADWFMRPLLEKVISNNLEAKSLATLRDTLLPKLLSGELRVNDAEKFTEAAV